MAFFCTFGSALILLLCFQNRATSEVYHITPNGVTDDCSTCLALSQFAANSSFLKSNITLILQPGIHNLTVDLNISDKDYVSMVASNSTAQIMCEFSTGFSLQNVQYIRITNLEFTGCGKNLIENVMEFVLQDVIFEGQAQSETALKLIETTATLTNSTFKSNEYGTLRGNDSLHSNQFLAGGAIIATHSNISIRNSIFERNRAEAGGAIYAEQECIIAIEDTTFINNQAFKLLQSPTDDPSQAMGGVLYQESGSIQITNCQFTNNSAPGWNGGALYSYKSNVFIEASQFMNCTANYGAILFSYNGSVSMNSSQFDRNTATWGGVMYSSNSNVLIDRSQFSNNRATIGGIIDSLNSSVTFNDCQFDLNQATWGGVLHLMEHSKATITGSQFNSSRATTRGAVFYSNTSDIMIQTSQFYNNSAAGEEYTQGGVLFSLSGNVLINSSQFYNNAALRGGVLDCISSNISINGSRFHANKATFGGVIASFTSSIIIIESDSYFDGNAADYGAVVYAYTGFVTVRGGSEFNDNTASDQGGAIYSIQSKASVNESDFFRNSATEGGVLYSAEGNTMIDASNINHNRALTGGAIRIYKSELSIVESVLNNNTASSSGGVLFCHSDNNVTIQTSILRDNTATTAGALHCSDSNVVVQASILNKNTATAIAGALYCSHSNITIQESVLDGNNSTRGGVLYSANSNIVISSSEVNNSRANGRGPGGVLYSFNSTVKVFETLFHNNTATDDGGVVYSRNSDVIINDGYFSENIAIFNGGVLYSENGNITIRESFFCNSFAFVGGVVYSSNSIIVVQASILNNNIAPRVNFRDLVGALYSFNRFLFRYIDTGDGGVLYSRNSDIIINGSHFCGNNASFGGVLYSENGNITVNESFFCKNSAEVGGVLYSNSSNIFIDSSQFDSNTAMWGGVIDSFPSINVTIKNSQFTNNKVTSGGAALRSNIGYITIKNSRFHNNTSDRQGGVLHFFECQVTIEECQFNNNKALQGSVLYSLESTINALSLLIESNTANNHGTFYLSESTILLSETTFSNNIGSLLATATIVNFTHFNSFNNCTTSQLSRSNFREGGALTAFQSTVYFEGTTTFHSNLADSGGAVHSTESVLNVTGTTLIRNNRVRRNGGGIYLSRSELLCQQNSSLRLVNNTALRQGGGLHAAGSSIKITIVVNETLLYIVGNSAKRGGGLWLESNSKLYILKRESFYTELPIYALQMIGNSADCGGAVYVNDDTDAATCESPSAECFFQVLAIYADQNPNISIVSLYFSRNHAQISEYSATLFGGLLDRCTVSPLAEAHNKIRDLNEPIYVYNQSGIDYFSDSAEFTPNTITSRPIQVCFCFNDYPDCSYLEPDRREVKKGQLFMVSLVAVDQVGRPVRASIQSSLKFSPSGLAEGQLFQRVTNSCTDLTFNVFSANRIEELSLYADGPCKDAELSKRIVRIRFLPCTCPIGFQPQAFNDTICECKCHRTISQNVEQCNDQMESFVRRITSSNVWIAYDNISGYLVYPNCPYDYCKPLSLRTSITLSQPNGSDAQCAFNRVSLLCGSCEPGLSLSLGSSRCLSCPRFWPVLVVVITLAALVAGVALVAMLLFLNLTVAVGSLNGIIFYANIVAAYRNIFFPYQSQPSFASVFISFLNLDLGIDTCFFEGMTTYSKTWLQLVFPFYVILLVVLLIVISSYSTKFANLIGKKDPVATLATLILLSYARLLGISFTALSAGTLKYAKGLSKIVWLPDATISYFSTLHIPLFIAAILIAIVGLVYTVVLFLWQWLLRLPAQRVFAWTRNQKLQIFIETYNIPYTPNHRYWTGMLLFVRIILYLVATLNVSNNPYIALTSITFVVVCILCLKGLIRGRVFKTWPIDLLETFFYFNLLFLSLFTWNFQNNDSINQEAIINISVIIAFIVLLLIILYHTYSYTVLFVKLRQTKIGKRLDEAFKSLSVSKPKQRKLETSEDNLLLDMVYRPMNTDGYSNTRDQQVKAQSEPTQSVVEVPIQKQFDSAEETTNTKESIISSHTHKESDYRSISNDKDNHVTDKTPGERQEESKL